MPRAPPGLSLLLMAALAFAATPPTTATTTKKTTYMMTMMKSSNPFEPDDHSLKIINPWLSACDLQQPASATDLKGACPDMWGPGSFCPPCRPNSTTQCLLLKESHKEKVCSLDPERRRIELRKLRMRHCCEHKVLSALPQEALHDDEETCRSKLGALLKVDALAARISCEFAEVLYRYDCGQKYSIKHQCEDCKEAYRKWVCSSMVPHYYNSTRVRPCPSVCQSVEQKCPYMLPGDRAPAHPTQYAGEPTFLCLDPNIPETGEQRLKSSEGDEDCCYNYSNCGGAPDRGGGGASLCVRCRHGLINITAAPVICSAGISNGTSGCSSGSSSVSGAASSSASRTLNKVLPLWTAWIILIQIILPQQQIIISITSMITNTVYNVISRYLLVMLCATSVRTSLLLTRIKTKWRKPWS